MQDSGLLLRTEKERRQSMNQAVIAGIIFLVAIICIMTEKVHRTTAAILGMVLLLAFKVMTLDQAVSYIDFNTLGVLIGMMLFVGVIKHSGLFEYISIKAAKKVNGDPWRIMVMFVILTAICSAFLDNVTTVLLMGPMTITIARLLEVDPVPTLMAQIFASNIGGTATMIGDPPNIMIGSEAHLSFAAFLLNTGVPCVIILVVLFAMLKFFYGKDMHASDAAIHKVMLLDEKKAIADPKLMKQSIVMIVLVTIGFMFHDQFGYQTAFVALAAGGIMMLIGHVDIDEVVANVEWPTLLFFTGLFVLVGGLEKTGIISALAKLIMSATGGHVIATMLVLLWASALLSSILDNIPFVATLIPFIHALGAHGMDTQPLWWAISLGACLGGNGTLIGASANVVLSGIAGKHGYPISFQSYLKKGFPVMIMSIIVSMIWLLLRFGFTA